MPKHIHVYKSGKEIAKVELPGFTILKGEMNNKLKKILLELIKEGRI